MNEELIDRIPGFIIFVFCGSAHEFCHAWSAYRLGDPTSRDLGRMTLNPLVHIDLFGTVVFPLFLLWSGLIPFGWMKPVPVMGMNLRQPARDMLFVSLAGPFANLFLGFLGLIVLVIIDGAGVQAPYLLQLWIWINLLLALFNLIPIPPLDGSSIVDYIRKDRGGSYHSQGILGVILLYALLLVGGITILGNIVLAIFRTMYDLPVLPFVIFAVLTGIAAWFHVKTSPRSRRPEKKEASGTRARRIFERAQRVGGMLAKGQPLAKDDSEWLERLRRDRGDESPLCSAISFHPENEFCTPCPNFNRCAHRLIQGMEGEGNSSRR